jgi:hypothetical protein
MEDWQHSYPPLPPNDSLGYYQFLFYFPIFELCNSGTTQRIGITSAIPFHLENLRVYNLTLQVRFFINYRARNVTDYKSMKLLQDFPKKPKKQTNKQTKTRQKTHPGD